MAGSLAPPSSSTLSGHESSTAMSKEILDDKAAAEIPVNQNRSRHSSISDEGIKWEYLTYETPLPDLIAVSTDPLAPQPPALKSYDSPFEWPDLRKNTCLALSCLVTFLAAYSASVYAFASEPLREQWSLSEVTYNTGVTTWALGFGIAPMFLAPFSEINGRRPIFLASGLVFLVSDIGCAVTDTFAGELVARFFQGAGASTFSTMVGGVLSDVYHAEDRNTPMAIYSGFVLSGTGFGPMLGGFIVARTSWQWVWWSHAIALGILMVFMVLLFKETRGSVLLSRKAAKINKYFDELDEYTRQKYPSHLPLSQHIRYKVLADENRASISRMVYLSTTTPFKFLATEPVVFFFSLWAAFAWGVLYMCFDVIPLAYQTAHDFNMTQQAGVFASIIVGSIIATVLSVYQDTLLGLTPFSRKMSLANPSSETKQAHNPESRLYLPCLLSPLLPIGLFWFGWTTNPHIHWIVPTIALALSQIGIFSIYLAVFNYMADTYHRYASSALAGQSFCRNIFAAVFPLFVDTMFRHLGFGAAGSLLGGVGLCLTAVPWVLVWKGPSIRARSKVASEAVY